MSTARETFDRLIAEITTSIAGMPLNNHLQQHLTQAFPENGEAFTSLTQACRQGVAEGWLCTREHGGIRYGRVIKPSPATAGFSVDVVEMEPIAGPHHRHPMGEIDMIMPLIDGAKFDGHGRGWLVYPPGHAHNPTVTGGKAIILYLLPDGAIEFT